jgi:hypothetical protein
MVDDNRRECTRSSSEQNLYNIPLACSICYVSMPCLPYCTDDDVFYLFLQK